MGGAAEDAQDSYAAAGAIANEAITSVRTVAAFSNEEYEVKRYAFHLREAMNFGVTLHTHTHIHTHIYDNMMYMYESCATDQKELVKWCHIGSDHVGVLWYVHNTP